MTVYVDTHVIVWLGQGDTNKLGAAATRAIDAADIMISPAVLLELQLLHEIGRLRRTPSKVFAMLAAEIGLRVCDLPFQAIVEQALQENWVRDPFDRLIVANAKAARAPLVTRDERIRAHYSRAIW